MNLRPLSLTKKQMNIVLNQQFECRCIGTIIFDAIRGLFDLKFFIKTSRASLDVAETHTSLPSLSEPILMSKLSTFFVLCSILSIPHPKISIGLTCLIDSRRLFIDGEY